MCYHGSKNYKKKDLQEYYSELQVIDPEIGDQIKPIFHENGFDHLATPVVYAREDKFELGLFNWGLIPWFTKPDKVAIIQNQTLNCISEEMFDKPSFRDSLKDGRRCLIPMTSFMEWKHYDNGKNKIPYNILVKDQKIFSVAGLWSQWENKDTGATSHTYTVLTCKANEMMSEIHNSKQRMPVIIPREYEYDWLNPTLTPEDVKAFCVPFDNSKMDAFVISKRITDKKQNSNVPEVLAPAESGLLF